MDGKTLQNAGGGSYSLRQGHKDFRRGPHVGHAWFKTPEDTRCVCRPVVTWLDLAE